jgi:hypothetical protein
MSTAGHGRENDTADEDQQQFTISLPYPEGKKQLGRPSHMWEENIKMDFREVGWDGMDYIYLAQVRDQWRAVVNTVMNFRHP